MSLSVTLTVTMVLGWARGRFDEAFAILVVIGKHSHLYFSFLSFRFLSLGILLLCLLLPGGFSSQLNLGKAHRALFRLTPSLLRKCG